MNSCIFISTSFRISLRRNFKMKFERFFLINIGRNFPKNQEGMHGEIPKGKTGRYVVEIPGEIPDSRFRGFSKKRL